MPIRGGMTEQDPAVGSPAVEGIAIGRAIVWAADPIAPRAVRTAQQEHARLAWALARSTSGVEELVRLLPRGEAELFEPELAILAELGPTLLARVDAGQRAEDAVNEITSEVSTDLLADARARLLDGLAHDRRSVESLLDGRDGERVLVTPTLTPSVVASLPVRVVGVVAASDEDPQGIGRESHAVILARARDIPLAFVRADVASAIGSDDTVVVDTTVTPASVWVTPSDAVVEDAHARREAWARTRTADEAKVTEPLTHLGIEVRVNIGSIYEHIPASAEGIGLVRTELVFSDHSSAPSEAEQHGALRAIATRAGGRPVVVRLFDGGADKALPWLSPPAGSEARGIELLRMHPEILDAQLRALAQLAPRIDVRVLLPFVSDASDVAQIRERSPRQLPLGAMIETPEAVVRCDSIAAASDFVCIGTNDLFAIVTGQRRMDAALSPDRRVLRMVQRVVEAAGIHRREVGVCGEMAGDPHGARILAGLGVQVLSVATSRFAKAKLSLREVSIDDCRDVAREALA
jgi:phosphoenolpyruvate-protein kinase (PTS system EI component)